MNDERYSIGELATVAATTPRTIRFYTAEGLLPPPLTEGRNAIYSDAHRRRLRLIQRLKAAYLPLSAIKEQLAGLTDEQVDTLLERSGPNRLENTAPPHGARAVPSPSAGAPANVAYVAQILAAAEQALAASPISETAGHAKRVLIVSPALRSERDSDAVDEPGGAADGAAPELWSRVMLGPGVELHLRETVASTRRAEIDRIVALARSLFKEL